MFDLLLRPSFFCSYAHSTGSSIATLSNHSCIINSGATNHMTSHSHLYTSYKPCSGKHKIKIVDGSLSSVAGKWCIPLSNSHLTLPYMFHNFCLVPFPLAKSLKIIIVLLSFFPSYCGFQDLRTGKLIGVGKEVDGLYYFENELTSLGNLS